MIEKFKSSINLRNVLPLLILAFVIASPNDAAAADFISKALGNAFAQKVIQVLGSIGLAMTIAGIVQGFISGSNGDWLMKGVGVIAGVFLIVDPSIMASTFKAMGL